MPIFPRPGRRPAPHDCRDHPAPLLTRLGADRTGNFSIITALMLVPLIGVAGLALDFARVLELRNNLMGAADAAALGALRTNAISSVSGDQATLPPDEAKALFQGNGATSNIWPDAQWTTNASVQKDSSVLSSRVTFEAKIPTTLMKILGRDTMTISGEATAKMDLPPYMDFYMLLDNSPSMGLAATTKDMKKMQANTSDKCSFACHETGKKNNYYELAKTLSVAMRIDVVRDAVQQLTTAAKASRIWADQYRMGVYTFGEKAEDVKLTAVAAPSADMDAVASDVGDVDLMTTPYNGYKSNQITIFDDSLGTIKDVIGMSGSGLSAASRQKVLFFVSDGVAHQYKPNACTGANNGTACMEPVLAKYCRALKANGVKIAVLYTTYLPLPGDWAWETFVSKFIDRVPSAMEKCASDDLYFEVSKGEDIAARLHDLFYKVTGVPRLTN